MRSLPLVNFILLFVLTAFVVCAEDNPDEKPKTDAMLFGDVKSEGQHIPFATIMIKGTTIGAAADATGHFAMTNLPEGEQTAVISAIGYKTSEKKVQLISNKSVTILVDLEPDVIGLEQVVVSADRNEKSRKKAPAIVTSINAKLFERTQNVTLSEGLNFAPGMRMENNCQNCGFSQVRMNGLEGPYSQILINSRPVFSGLAGVYGLELIPANMIERVEVIRGGGSSMYGSNAIAGTINLITKDPIANLFSASVSRAVNGVSKNYDAAGDYNINLNGSMVSSDYKTGVSLFGFHRNRNHFDANGDGFSELAAIENVTVGTRIYQRVANRGKITLDYFHINESRRGGNKFELPLHESDISESVDHRINSSAINYDLLLRDNDKFSVFASSQNVDRDSYYGANQDLSAYGNTQDFTYSTGIQYVLQLNNLLFSPATITSGLEINGSSLTDKKLGYYDPETDTHFGNTLVADQKITTKAGFVQSEWKGNKLVFSTGLRFDHYNIADKTGTNETAEGNVFSPRVNVLYDFTKSFNFRAGFARGFRAPQIFDEDLHILTSGSRKVLHRNDESLKQETSNSFTTSFGYSNSSGKWQYQVLVEGFYTHLINPFANEYGTENEEGVVIYTRINANEGATVKGINLEFNASPSPRFQLQSGFTVQKSRYSEPPAFDESRFLRTPDSYGYFSLNYVPSDKFDVAFTGNYTGSMLVPYFGPRLAEEKREEGRLNKSGSFFESGIKLCYHIHFTESSEIEINCGVKNMLNSYQDDFDTGIDRDPGYIYGPLSPRTIYFGIKIGNL